MMAAAGRWRLLVSSVFFATLFLLGIALHRDYGVSWDEPTDHQNGAVSGRYVAELLLPETLRNHPTLATIPPLAGYIDNDHGVLFELPVAGLGFLFTSGDPQAYYFMRHLLIFLVFVGGVWAIYKLGSLYFQDWRWGLFSSLALVLSPRFFAEAFFNGKDIPFMVLFSLGIYTLVRVLERPTGGRVAVHALATAGAICLRVPGILLLAFTLGMLALEMRWPVTTHRLPARRWLLLMGLYLGLTATLTVAGWPALWANPVASFRQAYSSMSHFNWPPGTTFYLGQYVSARQLPWHYIPVWLVISTPLLYTLAALLGLGAAAYAAWQHGWKRLHTRAGRLDLLLAGWLFGPVLIVIILQSVLYNGWRHLYFIYPPLLLWAVQGARILLTWVKSRPQGWPLGTIGLGVAGLELLHLGVQMQQLHPYQHLYFSVLSPTAVERLVERDYWGLGFRQGLKWILAHDAAPQLSINASNRHPLYNNLLILSAPDRARFRYQPTADARYFITNYRRHPQSYLDSMGTEVYVVRAGGVKILSVFRR